MKKPAVFFALLTFLFCVGAQAQNIIYVNDDAAGANNGTSWADAFTDFQAGVDAASSGDSVFVAAGTYQPASGQYFSMKQGVKIYGSFAGTESSLAQRPYPPAGGLQGAGASILKGNGSSVIRNNNNGLDSSAVLDGFKISGGSAAWGGGVYNEKSSPVITHCMVSGNHADINGGGICNFKCTPIVTGNIICGNTGEFGGGVYNSEATVKIINCAIFGNKATQTAGGVYSNESAVQIINCTVSGNIAVTAVGGIFNYKTTEPALITNSVIVGNTSGNDGRNGVSNGQGTSEITYSLVQDMTGGTNGNLDGSTDPLFVNAPNASTAPFTGGDYNLSRFSPLIKKGNNDSLYHALSSASGGGAGGGFDLAGNARIAFGTVDIGAYESTQPPVTPDANGIVYVDSAAAAGGDGSSWDKALSSFGDALAAAKNINASATTAADSVHQIWVAKGTYKPAYSVEDGQRGTDGGRNNAFMLPDSVKIYGGFAGTETSPEERNTVNLFTANRTVLSGDLDNSGGISDGDAYHVVMAVNIDSATLDGFVVTGGNADYDAQHPVYGQDIPSLYGGGIYVGYRSSPVLSHVMVMACHAGKHGGGLYIYQSTPALTYVTITNNHADNDGGGLYNEQSVPALTYVTITNNHADNHAGGMCNYKSSPVIMKSIISDNRADGNGGGMGNFDHSSPVLANVIIKGNRAGTGGGMFNRDHSSPVLFDVAITGNQADEHGGGMYNKTNASPILTNVTISGNKASYGVLTNWTNSDPILTNCIIYGNSGGIKGDGTLRITYSLVQGLSGGTDGNLDGSTDPLFVNAQPDSVAPFTGGDYRLTRFSPLINKGNNDSILKDITADLAGNARIAFGTVDIGAYESMQPPVTPDANGIVYVDSAAASGGDGSSWDKALNYLSDATFAANLDTAGNIKEIHVAKGTYYPTGAQSGTIRDSSFALFRGGLKLLGGYPSGGGERSLNGAEGSGTILSGDIGDATTTADNSYHVMVIAGIPSGSDSLIIDGVTVTAGKANGHDDKEYNGTNIDRNIGGGIVCLSDTMHLIIRNSNILNNRGIRAAGIANAAIDLQIVNSMISGNQATDIGGGIANQSASPWITNCTFTGNTAQLGGGMVSLESSPVITNCTFTANKAQQLGGGMLNGQSFPVITNCTFTRNTAQAGGGIHNASSSPVITNCTFTRNTAQAGSGIYNGASSPVISNSIIYGNSGNGVINISQNSNPIVTYSILQDSIAGNGNIILTEDHPKVFTDTANGDYSLTRFSPAINKGNNDSLYHALPSASGGEAGGGSDLAGNPRIAFGTVDIGAYESTQPPVMADAAGTLYVDSAAAAGGDGSSWDKALNYLSDATFAANLDTAGNIKEIHVAKGTYYPTGAQSDTARDSSFAFFRGGLKLLGGYPTGGGERSLSGSEGSGTILSGDIGNATDTADNSYHVMIILGIPAGSDSLIMDGFTVTAGNANGDGEKEYNGIKISQNYGGGIFSEWDTTHLTIRNCHIVNNRAVNAAGMANAVTDLQIVNSTISGNRAVNNGGGIFNEEASLAITNCTFTKNTTGQVGGGIANLKSPIVLTNCTFSGNTAQNGGGMANIQSSFPVITNCTFIGNTATDQQFGGGGMINASSSPVISNSIIYGNTGNGIMNIDQGSKPVVTYSIVQDSIAGDGNILLPEDHPQVFTDTAKGDYSLRAGSPAINRGNNDSIPAWDTTDIAGNVRVYNKANGGIVDLGAYEYQGNPDSTRIIRQPEDTVVCIGNDGALFSVEATGADLHYQWQSFVEDTWSNIPDATKQALTFSPISLSDSGTLYRVIAMGDWSTDTSAAAMLHVNHMTAISIQPQDKTVCENDAASFTVKATGTDLTYRWQSSADGNEWKNVTDGTSATLELPDRSTADNGMQYHVIVSGACGEITSSAVTLTVKAKTILATQPENVVVCDGDEATFRVKATGTNISYQWQSSSDGTDWKNVPDGTSGTLDLSGLSTADNGTKYHVIVTGTCGEVISNAVTLTVNPLPVIAITADLDNPVSRGAVAHLTASGADTYRWDFAAGIQGGQNSAMMAVRPTENTTYTVTGTSAEGCRSEETFEVQVVKDYKLVANNIVSPNGDGKNDTWFIQNIDVYPDNKVMIYDRAGRLIYQKENYNNQWNGTVVGRTLKTGTYYYVFLVDGGKKIFKGYIELLTGK